MTLIRSLPTKPHAGQKPGTSGLRKKVKVFQEENYLANFVQSIFNALPPTDYVGKTLLCSGDGRYFNKEAIKIIAQIAAGNKVGRLWVGVNGWVSTPAASAIIRKRENGVCNGGILLTASHNPGGPNEDFGIKYNCGNGGPAPEWLTDKMYSETQKISEIKVVDLKEIDLCTLGVQQLTPEFQVEIINPFEDWMDMMREIFDFEMISSLLANEQFSFVYDGMNGIAGPYAKELFLKQLKAPPACLVQCECLEDFGGQHPDPNLTYAHKLVEIMKVNHPEAADASTPIFGAAGDGDNDRNMILGCGWFVTPSDSVAIIASYAEKCIPYYKSGLKGVARSMPTSMALKNVAIQRGIQHFEVPTGWKFFVNLMDANNCSICGEESFGTGGDHIREKDGLWAVLAWLSILAYRNKPSAHSTGHLVTVQQINEEFWTEFGRNYYTRYDYENVDAERADAMMKALVELKVEGLVEDMSLTETTREYLRKHPIAKIDNFHYTDPVDKSVSRNQGVRVFFQDESRFVMRLSGTGSSGATVRLYMEKYEKQQDRLSFQTSQAMEQLVAVAIDMTKMEMYTSRNHPTVIT